MNEQRMVNFRLPAEIKEQLEAAAKEDSRTVSGLIVAIVDEDGIGKMIWLMGGFLTVIFAIVCPNEFELILEILELLA